MTLPDSSLAQAIETLYDLNVGVIGQAADRHEQPHKPLLLAVLDLIAAGQATPDHVPWSEALRDRFARNFEPVHLSHSRAKHDHLFACGFSKSAQCSAANSSFPPGRCMCCITAEVFGCPPSPSLPSCILPQHFEAIEIRTGFNADVVQRPRHRWRVR